LKLKQVLKLKGGKDLVRNFEANILPSRLSFTSLTAKYIRDSIYFKETE